MKTSLALLPLVIVIASYSSVSVADGHHHRHHRDYYNDGGYQQRGYYQPQQAYQQPQPYYQPDPRSHQGLAGGVVGSVLGYEIGNGNPLATGLGAAAGSFLGNGMRQ